MSGPDGRAPAEGRRRAEAGATRELIAMRVPGAIGQLERDGDVAAPSAGGAFLETRCRRYLPRHPFGGVEVEGATVGKVAIGPALCESAEAVRCHAQEVGWLKRHTPRRQPLELVAGGEGAIV